MKIVIDHDETFDEELFLETLDYVFESDENNVRFVSTDITEVVEVITEQ